MSLYANLALAEEAVLHVRMNVVTGGAANKRDDLYRTQGANRQLVGTSRAQIKSDIKGGTNFHQAVVQRAVANKVGNCEEQARVAFDYLTSHGGTNVAVVDLVGWNHVFVVLGADRLAGCSYKVLSQAKQPILGDFAVVCDPWVGMAWDLGRWVECIQTTLYLTKGIDNQTAPSVCKAMVREFQ
jgi:hypothetical protein